MLFLGHVSRNSPPTASSSHQGNFVLSPISSQPESSFQILRFSSCHFPGSDHHAWQAWCKSCGSKGPWRVDVQVAQGNPNQTTFDTPNNISAHPALGCTCVCIGSRSACPKTEVNDKIKYISTKKTLPIFSPLSNGQWPLGERTKMKQLSFLLRDWNHQTCGLSLGLYNHQYYYRHEIEIKHAHSIQPGSKTCSWLDSRSSVFPSMASMGLSLLKALVFNKIRHWN